MQLCTYSIHLYNAYKGVQPMARMAMMAMNVAQHKVINLLKTFFSHQFLLVFVCVMSGPRQLFFQCVPEMPTVWTPLNIPGIV